MTSFMLLFFIFVLPAFAGPNDGLVAYFPFEGSGRDFADAGGNGNDGLLLSAERAEGRFGGGIRLPSVTSHAFVRLSRNLTMKGDLTVAAWIRPESLDLHGENRLVFTDQFNLDLLHGRGRLDLFSGGRWHGTLTGTEPLKLGMWHHIVGTFTTVGNTGAFYVDGALVNTVTTPGPLDVIASPLRIGNTGLNSMVGGLDELRIYNRALSADEVQTLCRFEPFAAPRTEKNLNRMKQPKPNTDLIPTPCLYPTCPGYFSDVVIQEGNTFPQTKIQPKKSNQLEDNGIGGDVGNWNTDPSVYHDLLHHIEDLGLKWVRTNFWSPNPLNWQEVLVAPRQHRIPPDCDDFITALADRGIKIVLNLSAGAGLDGEEHQWWGTAGHGLLGEREPEWWFKTPAQRVQFADYARFMARHFKGRVQYYEIWNEPTEHVGGDPRAPIAMSDYLEVVSQVAPIIRDIDPGAKIVVGALGRFNEWERDWLRRVLSSVVSGLVDAVSWHPFYGESPLNDQARETTYWADYPSTVQAFKKEAASLGFEGEYMVEEMVWRTYRDFVPHESPHYTDIEAAKYAARAIVMHRSLGIKMVSNQILMPGVIQLLPRYYVIRTLCTVMAGADPIPWKIGIDNPPEELESCSFVLPDGSRLVALWLDTVASDYHPGVNITLNLGEISPDIVAGIDSLNGFQQPLQIHREHGELIIPNLLIRDYPLILRIDGK